MCNNQKLPADLIELHDVIKNIENKGVEAEFYIKQVKKLKNQFKYMTFDAATDLEEQIVQARLVTIDLNKVLNDLFKFDLCSIYQALKSKPANKAYCASNNTQKENDNVVRTLIERLEDMLDQLETICVDNFIMKETVTSMCNQRIDLINCDPCVESVKSQKPCRPEVKIRLAGLMEANEALRRKLKCIEDKIKYLRSLQKMSGMNEA